MVTRSTSGIGYETLINIIMSGIPQIRKVAPCHWQDNANCRKFFCELAAAKGFDPLVADNWKNITFRDIKAVGVSTVRILPPLCVGCYI
jgi:hypothetical protein